MENGSKSLEIRSPVKVLNDVCISAANQLGLDMEKIALLSSKKLLRAAKPVHGYVEGHFMPPYDIMHRDQYFK